ncbi:MAG TPA: pyridoxal-phosphate dependent enzyme [Polyangiaceae bacterium]|jgi:cystathionine beta-synthase|nr:pyridoxal-phosphate dependent enzyme [Polyangiaceae bacterium]
MSDQARQPTIPPAPAHGVLALIGNTPLVRVETFDTGPCELYVKLENSNPGGSIKDRIGLSMIEAAEKSGAIKPGVTLVEATAGNTGLGLALVAAQKGYKLLLVIPDKMSQEKINHVRAMGAEVRMTRSDVGKGHPEYYQDMAERIAGEIGGFYVNQFGNPANPLAHETTTAPEIWQQTGGKLSAVVAGVGSGGTITGLSRYFERVAPEVEIVLGDPVGSVLADYIATGKVGTAGSWLVEGVGEDFIPPICDLSRVKTAYSISDEESLLTARALLKQEGILAGSSSGMLLAAALRYCRDQKEPKRVVTFVCDTGGKYLSKMFNDYWMHDQGFLRGPNKGDLRDVIGRSHEEGATVSVAPTDTLLVAYSRMKLYDVSQIVVFDGSRIVGIIDESDLLLAVHASEQEYKRPVRDFMTTRLFTVPPSADLESLFPLLENGLVVIVCEGDKFYGLVTRIDVLNYLRRKLR